MILTEIHKQRMRDIEALSPTWDVLSKTFPQGLRIYVEYDTERLPEPKVVDWKKWKWNLCPDNAEACMGRL